MYAHFPVEAHAVKCCGVNYFIARMTAPLADIACFEHVKCQFCDPIPHRYAANRGHWLFV